MSSVQNKLHDDEGGMLVYADENGQSEYLVCGFLSVGCLGVSRSRGLTATMAALVGPRRLGVHWEIIADY